MTITVKKITFPDHIATPEGSRINDNYINLINEVEVSCVVRLGSIPLTIGDLQQLREGETFSLHQKTDEPVEILLNNKVIARGDLMSCEDHFAIQITEVFS